MIFFFGTRESIIGTFKIENSTCDYCEQTGTQRISVFGKYAHIFWIPLFPIGRDVLAECTHCKRTLEKREFSPELNQLYLDNKTKAARPFWHWFGIGLVGIVMTLTFLIGMIS